MENFDSNKTPYAYIATSGDRTYGHMNVTIYNVIGSDNYWTYRPLLTVTSQIGSTDYDEQRKALYATRYGVVGPSRDQMSLRDLEESVKFMRKFERRLAKMEEENGPVKSYADLCWRVIVCSGVERAFINPNYGAGYSRLQDLPNHNVGNVVGKVDLYKALTKMENGLISMFDRKAA